MGAARGGGSTGVTGYEDDGEVALLQGSLGESSGTVKRFSEACSAAEMSYASVTQPSRGQDGMGELHLRRDERRASIECSEESGYRYARDYIMRAII